MVCVKKKKRERGRGRERERKRESKPSVNFRNLGEGEKTGRK